MRVISEKVTAMSREPGSEMFCSLILPTSALANSAKRSEANYTKICTASNIGATNVMLCNIEKPLHLSAKHG